MMSKIKMSSFRLHNELAKLPSIIEVERIAFKDRVKDPDNPPEPPPTGKGYAQLYMEDGILKYRGSDDTITPVANK